MATIPRILITPGEPSGIGPDITVQIAQLEWPAELIVIADPQLLHERAKQIGLPLSLTECDFSKPRESHQPTILKILPVGLNTKAEPGILDSENAEYVIRTLEKAHSLCFDKRADALVTGPVHKEILNKAGIDFTGHTEFFAKLSHVQQTVMLFVVDQLKVALVTTHLPLAEVSRAVTKEKLHKTLTIIHESLKNLFGIASPRMLVCGLNPHAGEGGYLGQEEIEVIEPALVELRAQGLNITGPLPADTIFTPKYLQQAEVVVGMFHDQVLPVVKYLGFGNAVNVTLGLPYVRTSVDHGTALDIAGTGKAESGSMVAAIKEALVILTLSSKPPSSA